MDFVRALRARRDVLAAAETLCASDVHKAADAVCTALSAHNKILTIGNGGSAAISQHFAAELVVRFVRARRAYPALALTADSTILTAAGNAFGYPTVFRRQIEAYAFPGDVVCAFSTSGSSPNVVTALETARDLRCVTVGFTGSAGVGLAPLCNVLCVVPSSVTAIIQEVHDMMVHFICEQVDGLS